MVAGAKIRLSGCGRGFVRLIDSPSAFRYPSSRLLRSIFLELASSLHSHWQTQQQPRRQSSLHAGLCGPIGPEGLPSPRLLPSDLTLRLFSTRPARKNTFTLQNQSHIVLKITTTTARDFPSPIIGKCDRALTSVEDCIRLWRSSQYGRLASSSTIKLSGMLTGELAKKSDAVKNGRVWLTLVIAMYTSATVHVAVNWWFQVQSWLLLGGHTESAILSLLYPPQWVQILLGATLTFNVFSADCLFASCPSTSMADPSNCGATDMALLVRLGT